MDKDTILCILAANCPDTAQCDFLNCGKIKITDSTTGKSFIVTVTQED